METKVMKLVKEIGQVFIITGLLAYVIWLQFSIPYAAPIFIIVGGIFYAAEKFVRVWQEETVKKEELKAPEPQAESVEEIETVG